MSPEMNESPQNVRPNCQGHNRHRSDWMAAITDRYDSSNTWNVKKRIVIWNEQLTNWTFIAKCQSQKITMTCRKPKSYFANYGDAEHIRRVKYSKFQNTLSRTIISSDKRKQIRRPKQAHNLYHIAKPQISSKQFQQISRPAKFHLVIA